MRAAKKIDEALDLPNYPTEHEIAEIIDREMADTLRDVVLRGISEAELKRVKTVTKAAEKMREALARICDWVEADCDPSTKSIETARAALAAYDKAVRGGGP